MAKNEYDEDVMAILESPTSIEFDEVMDVLGVDNNFSLKTPNPYESIKINEYDLEEVEKAIEKFKETLSNRGLGNPEIKPDTGIQFFEIGESHDRCGWYVFHSRSCSGGFGNTDTELRESWFFSQSSSGEIEKREDKKYNYALSEHSRVLIFNIVKNYCSKEDFDEFICIINEGLNNYLFTVEIQDNLDTFIGDEEQLSKVLTKTKNLLLGLDKLSYLDQVLLGNKTCLNSRVRNNKLVPLSTDFFYKGSPLNYLLSVEQALYDLYQATAIQINEARSARLKRGYKSELLLVTTINDACHKVCPELKIKKGSNSVSVQLMDFFVEAFNIKSQHKKIRNNVEHDHSLPSASGKAIISAWLALRDNPSK